MKTGIAKEYWAEFQKRNPKYKPVPLPIRNYFCDNEKDANDCAELVQKGIKRATTHAVSSLHIHNENLPAVGDIAIITDWYGNPQAIIKTIRLLFDMLSKHRRSRPEARPKMSRTSPDELSKRFFP
ncbi:ASCH domain-containing protein [Sphingobacterium paludis]|uniref:ASCH domain-containing protein n=1 Tax=Sphingobacterium paludis TaxID=1476465 RepID=A0A4R7D8E3_9SPHI|nr:ASCH domain-containing protein [Sphingobacterium paludis]TDS17519.1 ASCH domain-containing protein [Sphingobacterium paludis]